MKDSELAWRELQPSDLAAVVQLERRCFAVDGGLRSMFAPEAISERYLADGAQGLGAFDRDGSLVAAAAVHSTTFVGQVDPDYRNRGLGERLMQWANSLGHVTAVRTESLTGAADQLFRAHAFEQSEASWVMRRDLREPLPATSFPSDVTLVTWSPESEESFSRAYEPAFSDRPGFPGWTGAEWISRVKANDVRADWSLLSMAGGEAVGFVIGCADSSTNPPGGYVWQVGVVVSQRGRGIGSGLMLESMRRMQADGAPAVELVVHVDNPNAIRLYKSLGFGAVGRRAVYRRQKTESSSWVALSEPQS